MLKSRRRLEVAALGAVLAAVPCAGAAAQPPAQNQSQGNVVVGPPQIRDFDLGGERRTPPAEPQPVQPARPAPATQRPPATQPAGPPAQTRPAPGAETPPAASGQSRPAQPAPGPAPQPAPALPSQPEDVLQLPSAPAEGAPADAAPAEATPAPAAPESGGSFWPYLAAFALAALGGFALLRRRRRRAAARPVYVSPEAEAEQKPKPRPEPIQRPWIEIELKAERAASTPDEAVVDFELVIRNTGKSDARNIRINARLFNAGHEQDKEIGAFFKSRGEGRRTHAFPELPVGESGLIQGSVAMPREEMKALQVNEQLLFIPVIGVNVVYDWGEGRTGQTSKSYVIGRELGAENEKMGAFRLDLGPRVYRTVGIRQHTLARRV